MKWVADGHLAVMPHDCQQKAVSDSKTKEEEELSPTALPGDGLAQTYDTGKHVGDNDQGVESLWCGEDTWKELHGDVEVMLNTGNSHHNDIASQS